MSRRNRPATKPTPQEAAAGNSGLLILLSHPASHLFILLIATFLVYSNTFTIPFILDDLTSIIANPLVKEFHPVFKSRIIGDASFAFNYALHGLNLEGYHLFNLFVHCSNALLVYLLVILTCRAVITDTGLTSEYRSKIFQLAFLTAILFATHPLQTQAVTYLAQRVTSLAAFFYLGALVLYLTGRNSGSAKIKTASFCAAFLLALLAMFTKEIAVTLPFVMTLYELLLFRDNGKKRFIAVGLFFLASLVVPAAFMVGKFELGDMLGEISRITADSGAIPRSEYLFTQFRVIVRYLQLLLIPVGQNLDHHVILSRSFFEMPVIISFLLLLFIAASACYGIYRCKASSFDNLLLRMAALGVFWFFIAIALESSIFPIRDVMFEHRVYLPSVGMLLTIASLVFWLYCRIGHHFGRAVAGLMVMYVAGLSTATWNRNNTWLTPQSLWEDVVRKSPGKARGHGVLAGIYRESGRTDDAIREYSKAIALDPLDYTAYNNYGTICLERKNLTKAERLFSEAVRLNPKNSKIHYNIGRLNLERGSLQAALQAFEKAVEFAPDNARAYNNMGIVLYRLGKTQEAKDSFMRSIKADPGNAEARNNLRKLGYSN